MPLKSCIENDIKFSGQKKKYSVKKIIKPTTFSSILWPEKKQNGNITKQRHELSFSEQSSLTTMEFDHRKLLFITIRDSEDCLKKCPKKGCDDDCHFPKPPNLEAEMVRKSFLITGCLVSSVFVLFLVFMILKRYFSSRNDTTNDRFRERNQPILFDTQEDFLDEDHGPVVDHHIWYINTVGLPQSMIDSISVCKYKRGDGLIEGTECSVCLSEFEEDESVRLLPKCSHAFHVTCIDTWLRAHKNCPLCRAPIVCQNAAASATASWTSVSELNSGELELTEERQMENSESFGAIGDSRVEVGETSEVRVEDSGFVARSSDSRVLSDLREKRGSVGEETQLMRRSVSMDACSAQAIHRAVASVVSDLGSSDSHLRKPVKGSNLAVLSKRVSENLSLYKLMRSSSIGIKGPTLMKRSCSSSRRIFPSKHRRTQSSIIPS